MKRLILFVLLTMLVAALPTGAQEDTGTYFFTEDGSFAVYLPVGWSATGNAEDGLQIGNAETPVELLDEEEGSPQPGQAGMIVLALPAAALELEPDAYADVLEMMLASMDDEDMPPMSAVEEYDFAGRAAAMATGSNDENDAMFVSYAIAPGTFGIAVIVTAPGELDLHTEVMLEVLDGASYALPLEQTLEGGVSFDYPADWNAYEEEPGLLMIIENAEGVADQSTFNPGDYAMLLFPDLGALGMQGMDVSAIAADLAVSLFVENTDISAPISLDANGVAAGAVVFRSQEGVAGSVFVVGDDMDGYKGIIVAASEGESKLIDLTALNILLSVE